MEPYLVASSLSAVLAQLLVRTQRSACAGTGSIAGATCADCQGNVTKAAAVCSSYSPSTRNCARRIADGATATDSRNAAVEC